MFKSSRRVKVAQLGRVDDNIQYRVAVTGESPRTFIATVSKTCFTVRGPREQEIQRHFAHGPRREEGTIVNLGDIGR